MIDNPVYGLSSLPVKITKIDLSDSTTILHFYIKYRPGSWISIPEKSYIQDINGGKKLFVTKAEGVPLAEKYWIPASDEASYILYFPKLNNSVSKIDFGKDNLPQLVLLRA